MFVCSFVCYLSSLPLPSYTTDATTGSNIIIIIIIILIVNVEVLRASVFAWGFDIDPVVEGEWSTSLTSSVPRTVDAVGLVAQISDTFEFESHWREWMSKPSS